MMNDPENVDQVANLVKSISECVPVMLVPHLEAVWAVICNQKTIENTRYLLCLVLKQISQSQGACQLLVQSEKHMLVVEAACALLHSEDTGRA
jgi:hypothetical protein